MRILTLLIAAAVAGCASNPSSDPAPRESVQHLSEDSELFNQRSAHVDTIAASVLATMRAVVEAYEALEVPVTRVVDSQRRLETMNVPVNRIAGERMSRFLDCGQGVTGQRADNHNVTIYLMTSVLTAPGGQSRVLIEFDGSARPRTTSGNDVYCSSRGTLEDRLFEEVARRARAGSS